jgi:hypothetical protein
VSDAETMLTIMAERGKTPGYREAAQRGLAEVASLRAEVARERAAREEAERREKLMEETFLEEQTSHVETLAELDEARARAETAERRADEALGALRGLIDEIGASMSIHTPGTLIEEMERARRVLSGVGTAAPASCGQPIAEGFEDFPCTKPKGHEGGHDCTMALVRSSGGGAEGGGTT